MDKCWYAVLTRVGYEHRVATALRQQSRAQGHEEAFGEIIVPTEQVIALGADKKRRVKRRLFPGYLFVQMVLTKETWHLVHYTPKVVGFVGESSTTPTPIPAAEVQTIVQRAEAGRTAPHPKTLLTVGARVKVIAGPFRDFTGTIEAVNLRCSRLRVTVRVFGRPIPVELDCLQVEAL
jgi:transcriptional antiterminator NusG